MQNLLLPYLLMVYSLLAMGMVVISFFIYRAQKNILNKQLIYFWIWHVVNLVMNVGCSFFQEDWILALSCLSWPPLFALAFKILQAFEPEMKPSKYLNPLLILGYSLAGLFALLGYNFTYITLPPVLALGFSGFYMTWEFYKQIRSKENRTAEMILIVINLSFTVHMMDYPFLRPIEKYALFGFSYFLFNIVGFAAILPVLASKRLAERQRSELEELVKDRTEQLIHQSRLSALGEMAAGVAHEINNPLGIIVGRAEQVSNRIRRQQVDTEYLSTSMKVIEDTAFRISRITRALMDFSKQGAAIPYTVQELEKVMGEVCVLCEEKFKHRGIVLEQLIEPGLKVRSRGPQISQVILNLLNNAFDAVEKEESRWIKVEARRNGEKVYISVRDSGKGIPDELKDKIMQPFVTTKEVGKGTGLGLSISKGIVEAHGGQFYLHPSSLHTTFVLELPEASVI